MGENVAFVSFNTEMENIGAFGVTESICCMRLEFGWATLGYTMDTLDRGWGRYAFILKSPRTLSTKLLRKMSSLWVPICLASTMIKV